jgi:predicted enzyme related to lactoylglutathione lyase
MNRVVHFELSAKDFERAAKFYGDVFGWTFSKFEMPDGHVYWMINTGEEGPGINGGFMPQQEKPETINTLGVADVDAKVAAVVAAGGEVVFPKATIPTVGYLAYVKDTEGNVFGMMQDDPQAGM